METLNINKINSYNWNITKSIQIYLKRDAKRRLTHNEVERRRRDKINQWIMYLSKIIPDCAEENKTNYDNQVH